MAEPPTDKDTATDAKATKPAGATSAATTPGSRPMTARENEKDMAVIGDEDTVMGFGLAGVKYLVTVYDDTENTEIVFSLKDFMKIPEIGFVIITQSIAERIRSELEILKLDKPLYPIFIELPDKHGTVPDHVDPIRELIRRAIGMEVVKN